MATEDFSFPLVQKSTSTRSIDFPLLWRPDSCHEDEQDHSTPVENCNRRKSFACVEDQILVGTSTHVQDQEEKMDMLWEDFNEELYPARSTTSSEYNYMSGDMLQLGCVGFGAFKFSEPKAATTTGSAVTNTNPGVVVFVRALKRLLFLHNSHHHNLKKPAKR